MLQKFLGHLDLYGIAIVSGVSFSTVYQFLTDFTERELFGLSMIMWIALFIINIIDIHTGIKADTKRKKDLGTNFKFESGKGWRAIEKVFIFTAVIGFLFAAEREAIKMNVPEFISGLLVYIKAILFFYVFLIELQSIGENEEARYGKKNKIFLMLDRIIDAVNEGIISKIKKIISGDESSKNDDMQPIEQVEDIIEEINEEEENG